MRAILFAPIAIALVSCRSPTQIEVTVTTDVKCERWHGAAIAVGTLGEELEHAAATTSTVHCDASGHVGSVVVVPRDSEDAKIAIRVVAALDDNADVESCTESSSYKGCIVARRALNFIPHETLSLSVPMIGKCKDYPCSATETCVDRVCRPATFPDPAKCASQTCGEGDLPPSTGDDDGGADGGVPDATVNDGSSDAPDDSPAIDAPVGDGSVAACGTHCAIALGQKFSCALRDGGVACWGQSVQGETGSGSFSGVGPGAVVDTQDIPLSGAHGLIATYDTACAFLDDAGVSCWGVAAPFNGVFLGDAGALANATHTPFSPATVETTLGPLDFCTRADSNLLSCAGTNANGQLGTGDHTPATSLAPSNLPHPYAQVVMTDYLACALTQAGAVYCVGKNDTNESDPTAGTSTDVVLPAHAIPLAPAQEIAVGLESACARVASNVYCWGSNYHAASGTTAAAPGPNEIGVVGGGVLSGVTQLAAGDYFYCALTGAGGVYCWGEGDVGSLGRAVDAGDSKLAAPVLDVDGGTFSGAQHVAAQAGHACVLKSTGDVWCWGQNDQGQTAPADTTTRWMPAKMGL